MSTLFAHSALLFAGEAFVMSAVIVALAWEISHLFRDSASLRHLVWAGAFAALLALPLLALMVPTQIHFMLPSTPVVFIPLAQDVVATSVVVPQHVASSSFQFHVDVESVATALLAFWLVGVSVMALRGLLAVFGLRALERGSAVHELESIVVPETGRSYQIRIADAPNGYGPITWGLVRPVILLPFSARFWTRERLQAVLLHEAAHIRRHDSVCQMLSLLVCALYWPNPLVWMAARAMRGEAEIAADDEVIAAGVRPSCYAGELLQLASEYRAHQPAFAGMPLFMAAPSALEARVKSVLATTQSRSGVTSMDVLKIGTIAILATAALTFARPTFAQDIPPAPPPPAEALIPPAPPTPVTADIPPVPPVPPVVQVEPTKHVVNIREDVREHHGHKTRHVWVTMDGRPLTPEEQEKIRVQVADAEAQVRAAQPEIERAQADVRANEAVIRQMRDQAPRIEAQVRAELAKMQPQIDRAVAEARREGEDLKISEQINNAYKHVRVKIETKDHKIIMLHDGDAHDSDETEAQDDNE